MKVKIGHKIYDGEDDAVMIILSDTDKKNIANMLPHCTKYCVYPSEKISEADISQWMDDC